MTETNYNCMRCGDEDDHWIRADDTVICDECLEKNEG